MGNIGNGLSRMIDSSEGSSATNVDCVLLTE